MRSPSAHLGTTQYAGLLHVGEVLIPGGRGLPSFREARCAHHVDRMLSWMNASDLRGLRSLLAVLRFTPAPVIRLLFAMADRSERFPGPFGVALRMANIGVKGVVVTLYYSGVAEGPPILEVMGWDPDVVDVETEEPAVSGA